MAGIKEAVALDMMGDKISQGVTVMKHSTVQQTLIDLIERLLMNLEELKDEKAQDENFFLFCEKPICAKAEKPSVQQTDSIEKELKKLQERKHEQAQTEDRSLLCEKTLCAKAEGPSVQQTDSIEMQQKKLKERKHEQTQTEDRSLHREKATCAKVERSSAQQTLIDLIETLLKNLEEQRDEKVRQEEVEG